MCGRQKSWNVLLSSPILHRSSVARSCLEREDSYSLCGESRPPSSFGDVADNFIAWNCWRTSNPNQESRSPDNHTTFMTDLRCIFLFSTLDLATLTSSSASARALPALLRRSSSVKRQDGTAPISPNQSLQQGFLLSYSLIFVALCPCFLSMNLLATSHARGIGPSRGHGHG